MKIKIDELHRLLSSRFIQHWYADAVVQSMSEALIRSELFWRSTHGIIRYEWIIKKGISSWENYWRKKINDTTTFIKASKWNWYHIARKEVERLSNYHKTNNSFQITILEDIFPTNAFIDYLERFHKNNIGALIIGTTPKLVWLRWSWKKILWTNPIWFTFPNKQSPIIGDLSTSHVSLGKILELSLSGIEQDIVLNNLGNIIPSKEAISANNEFIWALLPFGWVASEHKWFNISLLIELITASLIGARSENGDMIIITFHKDNPVYQINGVDRLIKQILLADASIRIPWQNSINTYSKNIERWFLDILENKLTPLKLSAKEKTKILYEN